MLYRSNIGLDAYFKLQAQIYILNLDNITIFHSIRKTEQKKLKKIFLFKHIYQQFYYDQALDLVLSMFP